MNQPKVNGLSFNIYAIVALLVLLPLSTGFVTNLANRSSTDPDEDLIAENFGASPPTTIATDGMQISQWIDNGSLKLPEFVCDGDIEDFPDAFKKLFEGKNFGKMLLKLPAAK